MDYFFYNNIPFFKLTLPASKPRSSLPRFNSPTYQNVFNANVEAIKKVNKRLAHSWQDDVLNCQSDCAVADSSVTGPDPVSGAATCLASGFVPSAEDITDTKRTLTEGSLLVWAGREAKRRLDTVFTDLTETVDFTTFQVLQEVSGKAVTTIAACAVVRWFGSSRVRPCACTVVRVCSCARVQLCACATVRV